MKSFTLFFRGNAELLSSCFSDGFEAMLILLIPFTTVPNRLFLGLGCIESFSPETVETPSPFDTPLHGLKTGVNLTPHP